jgi:hypothetical protein
MTTKHVISESSACSVEGFRQPDMPDCETAATNEKRKAGRPRAVFDPDEVLALRRQGVSFRQIARRLRIGVGTARRAIQSHCDSPEACQNLLPGLPADEIAGARQEPQGAVRQIVG